MNFALFFVPPKRRQQNHGLHISSTNDINIGFSKVKVDLPNKFHSSDTWKLDRNSQHCQLNKKSRSHQAHACTQILNGSSRIWKCDNICRYTQNKWSVPCVYVIHLVFSQNLMFPHSKNRMSETPWVTESERKGMYTPLYKLWHVKHMQDSTWHKLAILRHYYMFQYIHASK